jgi:mRNA-degrading endonuclease RelE of RelBE toxin-antitoxin system
MTGEGFGMTYRVILQVKKDLGQIRVVEIGRRGDIY